LEVHQPKLGEYSEATQARFQVGHQVGDIARRIYDPKGAGTVLSVQVEGFEAALSRTQALIQNHRPIFEGGFRAAGALAFADVMLPVRQGRRRAWRMIEVKSSTTVKDYQRDDAAIQSFIVQSAGVPLASVAVAHIDSGWTYPGKEDYKGLLVEEDLTGEVLARRDEVQGWVADARAVVEQKTEPAITTGGHCTSPHECAFIRHCQQREPQADQPLAWLPNVRTNKLKAYVAAHPAGELRDVPDDLLNEQQKRVKDATVSGRTFFDVEGATKALRAHKPPAYFMDFETIQFAVPIWKGTRPYQQIPFQFSVHTVGPRGALAQEGFLDLSSEDPSKNFAEALVQACGDEGPVFVFNAGFEKARIRDLMERFPRLAGPLRAISNRIVDLLPVVRDHYYHPAQLGSWSIKDVLPAACPDLSYDDLGGVQDGGMAMVAFLEALAAETSAERKLQIKRELTAYCQLDTYAMVRLWELLSGRSLVT